MVSNPLSLEFTKHDIVSDSTFIHQTEDGKDVKFVNNLEIIQELFSIAT